MPGHARNTGGPATIRYEAEVPIAGESDVLVVGAGPAGIAAALASARNGARQSRSGTGRIS